MMRTLFWILLLGNVILFAVMLRGGFGWGEQAYQAQPPLHEEKIRLQEAPQSATTAKASPAPASTALPVAASAPVASAASAVSPAPAVSHEPVVSHAPAADTAPDAKPASAATPASEAKPAPPAKPASATGKRNNMICLEWGEFSSAELKHATEALSALRLGDKLSQRQVEYDTGYWVHIPPLHTKAAADRKVAQLKARGIKEYFIVPGTGTTRYAISLGMFRTQEAAQNYLEQLRARKVRSAQIGERASKLKTTVFMFNGVDALTETRLTAIKKDFAGSELKSISCALTK